MTGLAQDLRYALRQLRKSPGFTAVAVITLSLGIGANTAIFSVVNAVLLQPLPYPDANRLVRVWSVSDRFPLDVSSYPDFRDWSEPRRSFQQIAAYCDQSFNLSGGDHPQRLKGLRVSAGFFGVLGVKPVLGRFFSEDEQSAGRNHVVLLGEALWKNHFAANPGIIGSTLKLSDDTYTIIGILPSGLEFPPNRKDAVVVPLAPDPRRSHGFLSVVGRLKPGATVAEAQAELSTIASRLAGAYQEDKGQGVYVQPLQASFTNDYRRSLLILFGAVCFVLLIACANVANLFLGKAKSQQRELALRSSLGARRRRLIQQLLSESLVVGLIGGSLGLLLAGSLAKGLVALLTRNFFLPGAAAIGVDARVLAFALAASLVTSLLAGLVPAVSASNVSLSESLKEASRGMGVGIVRKRFRNALVVSEVALALVLLSGAGLMIKSLALLTRVDSGVRTDNVLAVDFTLGNSRFSHAATRSEFFQQVLGRVQRLAGVQSAAVVADIPLTDNEDILGFSIEGTSDPPDQRRDTRFNVVGPGYFSTLGIPLTAGRDFADTDTSDAPTVVLINQAMARRFWPNQNPIGQRITTDKKTWYTIAGIVGDVRQMGLRSEAMPEAYLCYLQDPYQWPYMSMLVRTNADPLKLFGHVVEAVWAVDKEQPVSSPTTLDQIRSNSIAEPRMIALLLGLFAGLAVVLASVGLYGVVSRLVTERTHEIGVRMALGARAPEVFRLVVGRGLILALIGTGLGLIGSAMASRALTSFLFNVGPTDPLTFVAVSLLLIAVTLIASYFPARRAAKVDPNVALRYE